MAVSSRSSSRLLALPAAALAVAVTMSLGACSADHPRFSSAGTAASRALPAAHPVAALHHQAAAAQRAAGKASAGPAASPQPAAPQPAAPQHSSRPGQQQGKKCTTDPADRAACRRPGGGRIHQNGGDVDGDGVFESNEPVGPGYKDPRAYDGGKTSGEVQCENLRKQGIDC